MLPLLSMHSKDTSHHDNAMVKIMTTSRLTVKKKKKKKGEVGWVENMENPGG